jgi:hypothetical protein
VDFTSKVIILMLIDIQGPCKEIGIDAPALKVQRPDRALAGYPSMGSIPNKAC